MNWKPISAALFTLALGCNNSATKTVGTTPTSAESQVVVAMIGKDAITMADLDKAAGREIFELRERTLDNMISERVVKAVAAKSGMSEDDFLKKQVEAKVPTVSVEEAKKFFEENKARLPPQLASQEFDAVKDTIVQGVTSQRRREAMGSIIEDIKSQAGVKVMLHAPKVQVAADGPAKGPKTAKVTIVEFSDFQCPYCSRGKKVMEEVVAKYGDKVRLVFRDFPLDFHDKAQKAAEAGQCANDQGPGLNALTGIVLNQIADQDIGIQRGHLKRPLSPRRHVFDTNFSALGCLEHACQVQHRLGLGPHNGRAIRHHAPDEFSARLGMHGVPNRLRHRGLAFEGEGGFGHLNCITNIEIVMH